MEEELGVYHVASPMSCLQPCPRAISRHAPQSPVLYINWQLVQKSGQMRAQCSVGETTSGVVCTRENSHPWIPAGVCRTVLLASCQRFLVCWLESSARSRLLWSTIAPGYMAGDMGEYWIDVLEPPKVRAKGFFESQCHRLDLNKVCMSSCRGTTAGHQALPMGCSLAQETVTTQRVYFHFSSTFSISYIVFVVE